MSEESFGESADGDFLAGYDASAAADWDDVVEPSAELTWLRHGDWTFTPEDDLLPLTDDSFTDAAFTDTDFADATFADATFADATFTDPAFADPAFAEGAGQLGDDSPPANL